ncbi:hypothetical protein [Flammeovirga sp. SJP92]|uniref:hypothetical protein n=1 Tax=Flammeovirga sp. SJP92 TaxID=1775430 RepID=UPI000788A677|nr:hypothetical protein [Flammeovirga sp. SJP92]KXX69506.1 hypothetical protein AVL50_15655 [Flammeovirga sp. SJP92]
MRKLFFQTSIIIFLLISNSVYSQIIKSDSLDLKKIRLIDELFYDYYSIPILDQQNKVFINRKIKAYQAFLENNKGSCYTPYVLHELGVYYKWNQEPEKAVKYLNKAITRTTDFTYKVIDTYPTLVYWQNSSLRYSLEYNLPKVKHQSYYTLSRICIENMQFEEALNWLDSADLYPSLTLDCLGDEVSFREDKIEIYYGLKDYEKVDELLQYKYFELMFEEADTTNIIAGETLKEVYSKAYLKKHFIDPIQKISDVKEDFSLLGEKQDLWDNLHIYYSDETDKVKSIKELNEVLKICKKDLISSYLYKTIEEYVLAK